MSKVTMQQIADQAGISRYTVSRVLNNRTVPVKKDTRDKVLRIAKQLNFRPNQLARSLRTGKTYNIGVICYGVNTTYFNDRYTGNIYEGVGRFFSATPYKLVFHCVMGDDPTQYLELMESRAVDGMIFHLFSKDIAFFKRHSLAPLKKLRIPFVAVHSTTEDIGCASVGLDCVKGGYMATAHLLNHGYESIAQVTPVVQKGFDSIHWQELSRGFEQAMKKTGKSINAENILYTDTINSQGGYDLADRLLCEKRTLPRAFFVVDSVVAYGMVRKFREAGIRVPEDTAIIGFSNLNPEADELIGLTTLSQPAREKGYRAGEILHRLLEKPGKAEADTVSLLEPELIINKSCGCHP